MNSFRSSSFAQEPEAVSPNQPGKPIWKGRLLFTLLIGILLFVFLADISLGSVSIPFTEVIRICLHLPIESNTEVWAQIIFKIRLPRAYAAVLSGSALALGGLQMQTLFRNPLAGPSVLGITAGASLGVAVVMLAGSGTLAIFSLGQLSVLGSWGLVLAAIAGASFIFVLVLILALKVKDNVVVLIIGIMIANLTISLVSIWQYFSAPEQIKDYLLWTFGSLGGVNADHLIVLSICVGLGILLSIWLIKPLNMLLLGENYARSMGLSIRLFRIAIIATTSILAGSVTAFCGPIGFVGIAVPHVARSFFNSSDHKVLVPGVCVIGAALMLFCDIVSKVPGSNAVLPINAVTALIGAPIVIGVVLRGRNLHSAF